MRFAWLSVALVAAAVALPSGQTPTPQPAADLARQIQAHYDTVRDFQAGFTQVYRGGFSKSLPQERGTVKIKKPGRMRWDYDAPARKEIWADGNRVYFYEPSTKQGTISPVPSGNDASTSALFLMDRGNLVRDFAPSLDANQPPASWRLTLIPKHPDEDVASLVIIVDRSTLKLQGLEKKDGQGGTTIWQFQNLKENVGLRDQDFVRNPPFPKGTEIVK